MLILIVLIGLGIRLLAWHWREFYPLGGDEQEYLSQAITLLRDRQYVELRLMRPPIYPLFLAVSIRLVDSLVQNLRLVQALISTATIPLVFLLSTEVARFSRRDTIRPALLAALLCALSYSLAVNATELLTETLFLFGLTALLWLLLRVARNGRLGEAALAGVILGGLCLLRSVALPMGVLGALWLAGGGRREAGGGRRETGWFRERAAPLLGFLVAAAIVVGPWTLRNAVTYGGLILIDTTGAENLWLDNDPAGREAVKAQLYAMGEDRLGRQQLAMRRGQEAIVADPGRFLAKAWGELQKFFALEFSDDMRARPSIWVPPAEVWMRLALGDGLWLLLLLAGGYGLARVPRSVGHPALWLFAPWALYVLLTTLIFHVELRYRLPLYPALLPFAALVLFPGKTPEGQVGTPGKTQQAASLLVPVVLLLLTLLHVNYPALAWQLGWKHVDLARAEAALGRGDAAAARGAATSALVGDDRSALARVALARAEILEHNLDDAQDWLSAAIESIPAHPHAHLLRGDLLRAAGDAGAAKPELAYETGSLEDLQAWSWARFTTPPPEQLRLGDGLDLGFIRGFHAPESGEEAYRWTTGQASLRLRAPPGASSLLLSLDAGRPDGSSVAVEVRGPGGMIERLQVTSGWHDYQLALPEMSVAGAEMLIELRSPTFAPRQFDPASPDGRVLGVRVRRAGFDEK